MVFVRNFACPPGIRKRKRPLGAGSKATRRSAAGLLEAIFFLRKSVIPTRPCSPNDSAARRRAIHTGEKRNIEATIFWTAFQQRFRKFSFDISGVFLLNIVILTLLSQIGFSGNLPNFKHPRTVLWNFAKYASSESSREFYEIALTGPKIGANVAKHYRNLEWYGDNLLDHTQNAENEYWAWKDQFWCSR